MKSIGILWAQYGPYHFARFAALKKLAGPTKVHAVEMADRSGNYAWDRASQTTELTTLCPGSVAESLSFWEVFRRARRTFAELELEVCFLPSYWPKQSLAALLAARSLGICTVMMNESHAGTARARGLAATIKRRLVGLFDAALVGGRPQKRYFASLGLLADKIFTGYDAVDNDYFSSRAEEIRSRAAETRSRFELPDHYFLSLGRFVAKKNLETLIRAYRKFLDSNPDSQTHLVLVGSGDEEPSLRKLSAALRLPVYQKAEAGFQATTDDGTVRLKPGVHFYGFRQIAENPVFYALADAFILPSVREEWGLVVNEAMASGLPVVISEAAGCAEDLLKPGSLTLRSKAPPEVCERLARLAGRIRLNGFVFDPSSPQSLANALCVLESVPAIRENMGKASVTLVEKFSCDNFAKNALAAARAAMGDKLTDAATSEEAAGLARRLTS